MIRAPAAIALTLLLSSPAAARIDPSGFGHLSFRQHPGTQLPLDARFIDEAGKRTSLGAAIGGRPSIVFLEYLRCQNLCSLVLTGATDALVRSGITPGNHVSMIAVSIDPRDIVTDAVAAQAMYAHRFPNPAEAATGIHFLTGSPEQAARVADSIGFPYQPDKQSGQFAHPAGFVITTPNGRISRYMLGLNPPAPAVAKAIAEAADGDITPPAHPLLLLCFGYDPDAGTAAAMAFRLVRLASLATVIACAALIAFLSLRRRTA